MRIGIVGKGRVGTALRAGWVRADHDIRLVGRQMDDLAQWADVLVLAVPFAAVESVAQSIGAVAGKVIIDCTNPIVTSADGMALSLGHTTSGAERLQALLPEARIVKTLNQVGAEVMADTGRFPYPPVQFMAGNDDVAKYVVAALLSDLGFEPLDAGGLSKARLLEPFALVWINQAIARGKGRDWAFGAMPQGTGA